MCIICIELEKNTLSPWEAKKNLSEIVWEDLDLNFKIIFIFCYQLLDKTKESEHYLKKLFEEI